MNFIRLHLTAFGKFTNRDITLTDGFNVIFGENEAGKSTLHAFIRGMLYGFKKAATGKRYYTPEQEKYRPWLGQGYAGLLEYAAGGRRYLVRRDFARDETAVFDALTGEDLTGSFRSDRRREYDFAVQHTGLSNVVFNNTVSVRQLGIAPEAELAAEVAGRLANLSSAGTEDISVQNALAQLQKAAEQVGTARAGAKPHGRAVARAELLAAELGRSDSVLSGLRELESRLAACCRRLNEQEAALAATTAALDNANRALLRQRLAKAREYRARQRELAAAGAELDRYAGFPLKRETAVRRLAQEQQAKDYGRQAVRAELAGLAERRRQIEEKLARQAAYTGLDESDLLAVNNGFARWRDLAEAVAAYGQELAGLQSELAATADALASYRSFGDGNAAAAERVAELDGIISRLEQQRQSSRAGQKRTSARRVPAGTFAIAGLLAVVAGYAGYRLDSLWLALLGVALAGFLLYYGRTTSGCGRRESPVTEHELAQARAELTAVLQTCGADSAREFWEKAGRYDALRQKQEGQSGRITAVEASRQRSEQKAAELLAAVSACLAKTGLLPEGKAPTEELVARFSAEFRANVELRREKAAIEEQIAVHREKLAGLDGEAAQLAAELAEVLNGTGAANAAEFLTGCEKRRAYDGLQEQLAGQTSLLDAVLQGKDFAVLEAAAAADPETVPDGTAGGSAEELTVAAERYRSEIGRLERERVELGTTIETQLRGLRNPAEIAEELAAAQQAAAGYAADLQAIELARETISELARDIHREFAPRLNRRVGEIIGAITGGRYRDVKITESIDVSTAAPETGAPVQITGLSAGTADQFYLAARLAIAELLTDNPGLPLILDDCFVHYDDKRLSNVLEFLAGLAGQHQIILLTCRQREEELLRELGIPFNAIGLAEAGKE